MLNTQSDHFIRFQKSEIHVFFASFAFLSAFFILLFRHRFFYLLLIYYAHSAQIALRAERRENEKNIKNIKTQFRKRN